MVTAIEASKVHNGRKKFNSELPETEIFEILPTTTLWKSSPAGGKKWGGKRGRGILSQGSLDEELKINVSVEWLWKAMKMISEKATRKY